MKYSSFICALALAAIVFAGNAIAQSSDVQKLLEHPVMVDNDQLAREPAVQKQQVVSMITEVFTPLEAQVPGVVKKMIAVANCESGLQQLSSDGSLITNPKSSAAGIFQVLLVTHRPDYERMGVDPKNAPDNIVFSRALVERKLRQGRPPFEDWVCA